MPNCSEKIVFSASKRKQTRLKVWGNESLTFQFYSKEASLNIYISSYSYIIEIPALDDANFNDFSNYKDIKNKKYYICNFVGMVMSLFFL